jgi:hypothetical protein
MTRKMRKLSEEQWQQFLALLRQYAKTRADLGLFLGMVTRSQADQQPVEDWKGTLDRLRKLPGYVSQIEETEQLISRVDELNPDSDLIELIAKIPPLDYKN